MGYALGIDLGTTFSAAATARDGRLEIFQLGERAAAIPSVVVLRADGEVLTGEAAERRSLSEPNRTAREFKRRLGDPTPIILGGTPYGAESLIGHLLRAIVTKVSEQMGGPPDAIALSHPASYGPYKLDLLSQAVRQADIGTVVWITEPEAAALHYALQERVPVGAAIAVYDFGGGTFDATILRKTEDGFERLGRPEGMERLGGIDFDEAVFAHVMETVRASGVDLDPSDPATLAAVARLREESRRAKEALSLDTDATLAVYLPGLHTDVRLTRDEFETMIRPRVAESIRALERAVRSAGLEFGGIDRTLLVGGTSRIPLIAEMVRETTGRPVAVDAHPKHTIALGAAYVAERSREAAPAVVDAAAAAAAAVAPTVAAPVAATATVAATAPEAHVPAETPALAVASAPAVARAPAVTPAPAVGSTTGPTPEPAATMASPASGGRRISRGVAVGAGLALVAVIAGAAFAFLPQGGGGATTPSATPGASTAPSASLAAVVATATPGPTPSNVPPTLTPTPTPAPTVVASIAPTPSHVPASIVPSPSAAVAATPHATAHATAAPTPHVTAAPTPRPTAAPTAAPTPAPTLAPTATALRARILGITVVAGRYVVRYQTIGYEDRLPGRHVHFFYDTVAQSQAGVPGRGPWVVYGGPNPFTGFKVAERPARANRICILVANANHTVIAGSGNCVAIP